MPRYSVQLFFLRGMWLCIEWCTSIQFHSLSLVVFTWLKFISHCIADFSTCDTVLFSPDVKDGTFGSSVTVSAIRNRNLLKQCSPIATTPSSNHVSPDEVSQCRYECWTIQQLLQPYSFSMIICMSFYYPSWNLIVLVYYTQCDLVTTWLKYSLTFSEPPSWSWNPFPSADLL